MLVFDPVAHEYHLDGLRLPSVSEVIAPIRPEFIGVSRDVLERKRELGTAVHLACELDDLGDLDEPSLDRVLIPYLEAWRRFRVESGARILRNEQQLAHPRLGYAGTLDREAELELIGPGRWVLDIKTSADPIPSYGVQMAGYDELLEAQDAMAPQAKPRRRATVHLRPDGSYRLHEFKNPNDIACFRALLSVHHWKESTK